MEALESEPAYLYLILAFNFSHDLDKLLFIL